MRSNTRMDRSTLTPSADRMDHRLTELEIKASFAEDLLDELNLVVVRQQQQIDLLTQEVQRLREASPAAESTGSSALNRAREDLPPHY
jgi:SlyX protein